MSDEINVNLNELKEDDDSLFDQDAVKEIEDTITPPAFNSEEWHDYVMSQFMDDELDGGKPVRDGLVRVAEKLIGPIVSRKIVDFISAGEQNRGTSTVHIRLKFIIKNELHPLHSVGLSWLVEDGIAEVNSRNTPPPFHLHSSATAASKAEAQALRKALRLRKMIAADEATPEDMVMDGDVYTPDVQILQEQVSVIDVLCRKLNMSVLDYINTGSIKYIFIEQVPTSKAQGMIKFLSEIQSGNKEKPTSKPYDPAWREKNHKRLNNDESPD